MSDASLATPAQAPAAHRWAPEDLVVAGVFCPVVDIQDTLEDLRRQTGAQAALLLVADDRAVLRSLCLAAGAEPAAGIIAALRSGIDSSATRGLQDFITAKVSDAEDVRFPMTMTTIVTRLEKICVEAHRAESAALLRDERWWGASHAMPSQARASIAVLFLDPRWVDDLSQPISSLATMVNGTAQVDNRRDRLLSVRIADRVGVGGELAMALHELLDVAVGVTHSELGALYLMDPDRRELVLAAQIDGSGDARADYPAIVDPDGATSTAYSCVHDKVLQTPPGLTDGTVLVTWGQSMDPSYIELTLGIPDHEPAKAAVGVISLGKSAPRRAESSELDVFGAHDLAALRHIALRMALRYAASARAEDAEALAALLAHGESAAVVPDQSGPRPSGHDVRPPTELARAASKIARRLSDMAALTRSHSATFRAAVADPNSLAAHGMSLLRVASVPESQDDTFAVQRPQDGGVNWEAVTSGQHRYVPDVDEHPSFRPHRENTRAELSVPVRVEGRVVGVVNLESPHRDAYANRVKLLGFLAAIVGLELADTRLQNTDTMHRYASQLLHEGHSIANQLDDLRKDLCLDAEPDQQLTALAVRARGVRSSIGPQGRWAGRTVPEITAAVFAAAQIPDCTPVADDTDWPAMSTDDTEVYGQLLWNICDNLKRHRASSPPTVTARIAMTEWGGQREAVLRITNYVRRTPSAIDFQDLYRDPKPDEATPRVGAALSGRLARSLGGTINAAFESATRLLTTTVAIPVPATAATPQSLPT